MRVFIFHEKGKKVCSKIVIKVSQHHFSLCTFQQLFFSLFTMLMPMSGLLKRGDFYIALGCVGGKRMELPIKFIS